VSEARFDLSHIGILIRSHAKYSVRGGSGLTFVILVIMLGLIVAGLLVDQLEGIRKELEIEHGRSFGRDDFVGLVVDQVAKPVLKHWLGSNDTGEAQVRFLLDERPALLSALFLILLALEPFMVAFGGFNQLSGDIANRGLRYLLLRTSRLNIVLARLIGTFLFSAVTSLFTVAVIVVYLAFRYDLYSVSGLATWGLYGWAALNLFSLPYLALCTWISTLMASPFGALAVAQIVVGIPIVLTKWAQLLMTGRMNLDWLDKLTPWGWKFDLFHPDLAKVGLAAAVMLGFFSLFTFLGARHFLRRDL
jgi:hypothetical protein